MSSKFFQLLCILSIVSFAAHSQDIEYPNEFVISENHIKEIVQYKLHYYYANERIYRDTIKKDIVDTFILYKCYFDSSGNIIQKDDDFRKNEPRETSWYTYQNSHSKGKEIHTETIKTVTPDVAVDTRDIRNRSKLFSITRYNSSEKPITVEEYWEHGIVITTQFIYNDKGLLQEKDIYNDKKLVEKFITEYIYW